MTEETTKVIDLQDSAALNRLLLRHGRKPLNEVADMLGLPVGEVMERYDKLVNAGSYRDVLQEQKFLNLEMGELMSDIRERMDTAGKDEDYAKLAQVLVNSYKIMSDRLAEQTARVDNELERVSTAHARLMARAIRLAMEKAVLDLREMNPDISSDAVEAAFYEALPIAIAEIEEQVE